MPDFLLDTNILLRLADRQAAEYEVCQQAIKKLLQQPSRLVIVPQNIVEFWAVATRPQSANGFGWTVENTQQHLEQIIDQFELLQDNEAVFRIWFDLVVRYAVSGKQVHDTRIAAAGIAHQISHLLTLNEADFKRFSQIISIDPSQL